MMFGLFLSKAAKALGIAKADAFLKIRKFRLRHNFGFIFHADTDTVQ